MPWFKVDDQLHEHKKARKAGAAALGLWTLAGSWCAEHLTDGFIPEDVAARWARNHKALATKLVEANLWTVASKDGEDGWQFHDWLEFQPSADVTRQKRQAAKDRMQTIRGRGLKAVR